MLLDENEQKSQTDLGDEKDQQKRTIIIRRVKLIKHKHLLVTKNSLKLIDEKIDFVLNITCSNFFENVLDAYKKPFFRDFETFLITKQFDEDYMKKFSKLYNDQFIDFEGTAENFKMKPAFKKY